MLDSGATTHFIYIEADINNKRPAKNPLSVIIPDGTTLQASHECDINWPCLPQSARIGHILPGLKNKTLLSVIQLCEAGCTVLFKHHYYLVKYKTKSLRMARHTPLQNYS